MPTAIITWASDGIGASIAQKLITQGWEVVGISRTQPKNKKIKYIQGDLTNNTDIERIIETIKSTYSNFTAIIHCAGAYHGKELETTKPEDIDNVLQLNTAAPIKLYAWLINTIKKNKADIIHIVSKTAFEPHTSIYGTSKWWLRWFTEYLQWELKQTKCRVIGIYPGGVKTKLLEKAHAYEANYTNYMSPEEVANIIVRTITAVPKNIEISQMILNWK